MLQEAAREREIEERERKLGALMAEKGATGQKKKTSKVCVLCCGMPCQVMYSHCIRAGNHSATQPFSYITA